jgi:hypothetical protein
MALAGGDGEPGGLLMTSASTKVASRWKTLRTAVERSLAGNDEWGLLLNYALDQLANDDWELDVVLSIHNPGNLIQTLLFGFPDIITEYEPKIHGLAGPNKSVAIEISGKLHWAGRPVPNFIDLVHQVYPSPESWMLRRGDKYLLGRLGLHYTLHQSIVFPQDPSRSTESLNILIPHDGEVRQPNSRQDFIVCGWDDYLTLDDFAHAHRTEIRALINEYRVVIDMHQAG